MAKKTAPVAPTTTTTTTTPVAPVAPTANHTLTYRKNHPGNRCSYGIVGVPGIVVFDMKLFADGKPPATIVLDCALAVPTPKAEKADKAKPVAA